jgi:hypothetical protein
MWAFKRRLNIILLILATILCFGVIPYFLAHREVPTCFDGKMNQREEGIDCGGGCALVCKGGAQDLKVLWNRIDEIRPGVFEVAFSIENPNINVSAKSVPYTLRFIGRDGVEIGQRSGITYAGPNEAFLIYEGNIMTGNDTLASADLSFQEFSWIASEKRQEQFTVMDKELKNIDTKPKLTALVRNDTTIPQEKVEIAAIVSDDAGETVGYGKTYIDRLLPDESKPVTFSWTKPFSYQASLESCDIPVDVMLVFDRSGSMQSDGKNPPEPLTTAKNAVIGFLGKFRSQDQVGVVSFATAPTSPIDRALTREKERAEEAVQKIEIGTDGTQYTNIGDALKQARIELSSRRKNPDATQAMILLTDGDPTYPENPIDTQYPLTYASDAAKSVISDGVTLYAIGLGGGVRGEYLTSLVGDPEKYFFAESADDLSGIYDRISSVLCKKAPSVIEVLPRVNNVSR